MQNEDITVDDVKFGVYLWQKGESIESIKSK